ncbi:MAG: hypothetical protein ACRCXL_17130 [Dermatophilaceae bacterium]
MARFLTIGYGDRAGYDRTSDDLRTAAHDHDAGLVAAGAAVGRMRDPVQVRNHQGRDVTTETSSFTTSALPVAGFALIEANSLDDAIAMASGTPCAVADEVVEVWQVPE